LYFIYDTVLFFYTLNKFLKLLSSQNADVETHAYISKKLSLQFT